MYERFLAPAELRTIFETAIGKDIEGAGSADDGGAVGNSTEGRKVHVVHVGMGEEDQIDAREIIGIERGADDAFAADGGDAELRADAIEKDGIGEDVHAEEIEEDSGVAYPADIHGVVRPGGEVRGGDLDDIPAKIVEAAAEDAGAERWGIV